MADQDCSDRYFHSDGGTPQALMNKSWFPSSLERIGKVRFALLFIAATSVVTIALRSTRVVMSTNLLGLAKPKTSHTISRYHQVTKRMNSFDKLYETASWPFAWNVLQQQLRWARIGARSQPEPAAPAPQKWYIDKRGRVIERDASRPVKPDSLVYSPEDNPFEMLWGAVSEEAMGDNTASLFDASTGVWSGRIIPGRNDFAAVKSVLEPALDLTSCVGFRLQVKGQGQRFNFIIRDDEQFGDYAWSYIFDTDLSSETDVSILFSDFQPMKYGEVDASAPDLNTAAITTLQLSYSKAELEGQPNLEFDRGAFELEVQKISTLSWRALLNEPKHE